MSFYVFVSIFIPFWSLMPPLQELNVRQLTLSTDKDKYGIRLRAEPDHMVLGKRLKGAFKSVTASIKELKSEQLEAFQKTGEFALLWASSAFWAKQYC